MARHPYNFIIQSEKNINYIQSEVKLMLSPGLSCDIKAYSDWHKMAFAGMQLIC